MMTANAARKDASGYLDVSITLERLAGDEELFAEIAQILVQTAPEHLRTISAALAANDMKRGYEEAHSLKGAVAAFEAPEVFQAVAAVERYAKGDDAVAARAALSSAQTLVETLLVELQPHLPAR